MALLKVLFGIRRIALSRVKIYDLILIGCITVMTVLVFGCLIHSPGVECCYGREETENKVARCSLLRHDFFSHGFLCLL